MKAELREVFRNMQIEEFAEFCNETGADMYKLVCAVLKREKTYYLICPGDHSAYAIVAIKTIRCITGMGLKEAKDLIDANRCTIKAGGVSVPVFGPFEFKNPPRLSSIVDPLILRVEEK